MDATLKQRILGVVVLVGLLGFCLTVLLHNTKTQPHIVKINTHPPFAQTLPAVETQNIAPPQQTPNSVFTKSTTPSTPPSTSTATKTQTTPSVETQNIASAQENVGSVQTAAAPTPVILSTPATPTAPAVAKSDIQAAPNNAETQNLTKTQNIAKTQNVASLQQPDVTPATTQATLNTAASTTPISTPTPTHQSHKQHHSHMTAKPTHKESSQKAATAGSKENLMVQVGTFSIATNAQTLVKKLHSKGFSATAEKMKTAKGEMTRVIVGKKGLDHAQAETLRKSLENSMKLNGIIISHAKA